MMVLLLQQIPSVTPNTPPPSTFVHYIAPWVGPVIIAAVVTFIGQIILNKINQNRETNKEQQSGWIDAVMPLQEACDDLIARYFDIFARKRSVQFGKFDANNCNIVDQLADPSKELTIVYRLIKIFVGSVYLQRRSPCYPHIPRIKQSNYYIGNKFRMALKGNLTGSPLRLSTETQQYIGSKFLYSTTNKTPYEMDFYHFLNSINNDQISTQLANISSSILKFDHDILQLKSEQISFIIALVYLIDFHQDLMNTSKWEEFRVLLVSSIVAWNRASGRQAIFLYRPKDLDSDNYFNTFPILDFLSESDNKKINRIRKRQSRGRQVVDFGVIKATQRGTQELRFKSSPGDVLVALQSVLGVSAS